MLLAIADFADDDGRAYPSITRLATKCRTKPRYAMVLLDSLAASGELAVLKGQGPAGRGGRTNLYRIVFDKLARKHCEAVNHGAPVHPGSVGQSGAPVNQAAPVHQGSGSSEPGFREVVNQGAPKPSVNHQEPKDKNARMRASDVDRPQGVDCQVWNDWLTLRKSKKAAVTQTVMTGAIDEARKADMSLDAFLRIWCLRGTTGLQAEWLKPHERQVARPGAANKHTGFETKNYREGVTDDGRIA